jgi:putative heme transporter
MNHVTTTATPSAPVVQGDTGSTSPRESRSATVRHLLRSFKVLALLFVIYYLVLPNLAGQAKSIRQLAHVNVLLLTLALALEGAALLSYSLLTRAALPRNSISIGTLFRVQLATKAIGNVTPAGGASSAALGYRLITRAGVNSSDAGFALGAAGISSAVILNLLLWATLLISIPISGTNPIYVTVALVGVFILLFFGGLVFSLLRGQEQAERLARRIAAKITFLDEDRAAAVVTRLAMRLREIIAARHLLRQVVLWAVLNWVLDAASLWVFLRAFGGHARVDGLMVSFCIANVFAVIPITPGGLGIVDSVYPILLVFFGLPLSVVTLGVTSYRIAQFWLPIPIGGLMYGSLRLGPWRIDREGERLGSLRSQVSAGSDDPVYGIQDQAKPPLA